MIQDERDSPYAQFSPILNSLVDIVLGYSIGEVTKLIAYLSVEPVNLIVAGDCALTAIFNLQFAHTFLFLVVNLPCQVNKT